MTVPRVSVLMPTFDRAAFLGRAWASLGASTMADWELIVVDDGSTDETPQVLAGMAADRRVRQVRLTHNVGMGAALNVALGQAAAPVVAYLPSDDLYAPGHLAALLAVLEARPDAVAAVADLEGRAAGPPVAVQLVQVAHRRTADRWVERPELVSDDLERLFWGALRRRGGVVRTGQATCAWVEHPGQRSRVIRESTQGGLNPYRRRYGVRQPLRFQSTEGEYTDEVARYAPLAGRALPALDSEPLRILLVGELAYNPERILALEDRGHHLFGLWTPDGWFFNTVGPLPFGAVEEVSLTGWRDAVRRLRPDVIYALLNWQAVPFAWEVLRADLGVPFVWHFKEGPWFCIEQGTWPALVDLCTRADGVVFSSPEQQRWFELALPGRVDPQRCLVLDGDLPSGAWFTGEQSAPLSQTDGEPHTAVLGRPMGIDPAFIGRLAGAGIHTHCHGLIRSAAMARHWHTWVEEAKRLAPRHFHLEPTLEPADWVREVSRYDGGWLHVFTSQNSGDLRRATWDDLNYPARMGTIGAAGVPLLFQANPGSTVASADLADRLGIGIGFAEATDLRDRLDRELATGAARARAWQCRTAFSFDAHVDGLVAHLRVAIARRTAAT